MATFVGDVATDMETARREIAFLLRLAGGNVTAVRAALARTQATEREAGQDTRADRHAHGVLRVALLQLTGSRAQAARLTERASERGVV